MEFKSKNIRMLCFFWTHATCQKIYLLDLFDQKMTFTNSDLVCFIVAFAKSIILCYQRPASLFLYNWIKSFMGSFLNLHVKVLFHVIFWTHYDSSRNIFWSRRKEGGCTSNRFCTHCAKFWFFVPAWFTCCHLDFCKFCVLVPCKAL